MPKAFPAEFHRDVVGLFGFERGVVSLKDPRNRAGALRI
jgi:hypothetical protein